MMIPETVGYKLGSVRAIQSLPKQLSVHFKYFDYFIFYKKLFMILYTNHYPIPCIFEKLSTEF